MTRSHMDGRWARPLLIAAFLLSVPCGSAEEEEDCEKTRVEQGSTDILKQIFNESYDRNSIPSAYGVDVEVELLIQMVSEIDEIRSSFKLDVLFSQIWHDQRLNFEGMPFSHCLVNLSLSFRMVEKLWLPNVCFVNSKHSEVHESPTPNIFLAIFPNGTVWMNYRVVVEAPCVMDFSSFPMDKVWCEVVFESYSFNVGKVRLFWRRNNAPVMVIGNTKLPDFHTSEHSWDKHTYEYPAGIWDQLNFIMHFKRSWGFYILQIYLPTYCMVFISWIGFWLDHKALPARVTVGISSLMALALQFSNVSRTLPKVSYVKGLDLYMFGCMGFIFMSIVELACVSYLEKRKQRKERRRALKQSTWRKRTPTPPPVISTDQVGFDEAARLANSDLLDASTPNELPNGGPFSPQQLSEGAGSRINPFFMQEPKTDANFDSPNMELRSLVNIESSKRKHMRLHATERQEQKRLAERRAREAGTNEFKCWGARDWSGEHLDLFCRKVFPIVFSVLNLFYWIYYTQK